MNIEAVLSELDQMFANKKIDKVETFLMDKIEEAMKESDVSALITLLNEIIGYERDTSQYDKALLYSKEVIKLMKNVGLDNTMYYGTTLINVANVYRAARKLEESLDYYNQVFKLYEGNLEKTDFKYASLYNNMSLLYQEMDEYESAVESLKKALEIVKLYDDKKIQLAVTYGNLGESLLRLEKCDEAMIYLNKAYDIYKVDEIKDFHYSATLSALGEANYKLENYTQSAQYYEEALRELEVNVGHTEAYDITLSNLNKVYEAMGRNAVEKVNVRTEKDIDIFTGTGAEICEKFYEEYGKPMIEDKFSEYKDRIAVGLVGEGSDCFGCDDEFSRDHDYGPRFCMWLEEEDFNCIGTQLQKAYEELPTTFSGIKRVDTENGKRRHGVLSINQFYEEILNVDSIPSTEEDWYLVDEDKLATATNGKVYVDTLGTFTYIRKQLLKYYPEKLWRQKIATEAYNMAQLGQYNYARMIKREDYITSSIILADYIKHTMNMVYLLNRSYAPYYKWTYKCIKNLSILKEVYHMLSRLQDASSYEDRFNIIEEIAICVIGEMKKQGLTLTTDTYMESVIKDVLNMKTKKELIDEIVKLEWNAFDKVKNEGGRANCQDDWNTFSLMRKSQYMTWNEDMLKSYINDFDIANASGWNLITEKYGRMMETTTPEKYKELEPNLPIISQDKKAIMEEIIKIQVSWMEEFALKYPKAVLNARSIHTYEDTPFSTSYETYLRGELGTYSDNTLSLYGRFIVDLARNGENLGELTMTNTAFLYGYKSLDDLEKRL